MKVSARILLPLLGGATLGVPAVASGAGGTYDVVFCHELNRPFGGMIESTDAFSAHSRCSDSDQGNAVKIDSAGRAAEGRSANAYWEAPESLGLSGIEVEGRLRRGDGFASELFMADQLGHPTQTVASGGTTATDYKTYEWTGKPQRRFVARLECRKDPSCAESEQAKTWVRSVRLTVTDGADPEVEARGGLFEGGWLRGGVDVSAQGVDHGSGLTAVIVKSNTEPVLSAVGTCQGALSPRVAANFIPCEGAVQASTNRSTAELPFRNGTNEVETCATDFAGNTGCVSAQVKVDNELPTGTFANLAPEDPESIAVAVADEFSGLRTGAIFYRLAGSVDWRPLFTQTVGKELRARVDSTADEPGTYEFMATLTDVAGNTSQTTLREDGSPMTLEFPLKSGVGLSAHIKPGGSQRTTLGYGKSASVHGRLTDATGQPLPNMPVVVDEDFGEGALIDHRIRTVTTDESGRWSSKLPAGPNRSVSATYEGDQRYLEADVGAGRMTVRSGARLGLTKRRVREGNSTTFKGRVARLGARIPSRGKLLQIQYQDPTSGRWLTVRNPFRTRSDGRFRFKYGFGTHYVQDVGIRFRLKVPSEQGWPYRGSHTGARRVIVEARE